MSRIVNCTRSMRRGFTLIEMIIITIVLLIMAAMIVPNLVSLTRSRTLARAEAAIARAPMEARNEARRSHRPVRLRLEGDALVMERLPAETPVNVNSVNNRNNQNDQNDELFKRIPLDSAMRVESAQRSGNSTDLASWQWTVYPDGSADLAWLQFVVGADRKSLVLSRDGSGRWIQGDAPDTTQDQWPAGELEQRG